MVNDRAATAFARDVGVPQRVSFEEGQSEEGDLAAMMSLDLVWSTRLGSNITPGQLAPSLSTPTSSSLPTSSLRTRTEAGAPQQFVFFPDPGSEVPRHHGAELFDPVAFRQVTNNPDWEHIHRPVMLDLMHQAMATTVRVYRQLRLKPETPWPAPTRSAAPRPSFRPGMVRVRLPRSPLSVANGWLPAFRTGGFFIAVGSMTLLLVIVASRASHILAANQRARAEVTPSHNQSKPPEPAPLAVSTSAFTPLSDRSMADLAATSGLGTSAWAIVPAPVTPADTPVPPPRVLDEPAPPRELSARRPKLAATDGERAPVRIAPVSIVAESTTVGTLVVDSEPSGAIVSINGVTHGNTPLEIENLSVGTRVVRIELPGYERWSWAVNVVANKRTPVTVKLQPESRRIGASN